MKNGMKRIFAMLLVVIMVIGCLVGCAKPNDPEQTKPSGEKNPTNPPATQGGEDIPSEPITISILTRRHEESTNDAKDLWFFKYLEYWLAQQGYNVTIEVAQSSEYEQQLSLMFATDSLPDIVWGPELTTTNAVVYGAGEKMVLDWTPYLNEETMPNLMAAMTAEALAASTCIDGAVYSLPKIRRPNATNYNTPSTNFGMTDRMFVNSTWLEEFGLEIPTNIDEFLNMLRAFKNKKLDSGESVVPVSVNAKFLEKWIWGGLGYYGTVVEDGTEIAIKDDKIAIPAYSEDYREFVKLMRTLYEEGLISPDFYTMDTTTAQGIMSSGRCGVICDWTLGNTPLGKHQDFVSIPMLPIGGNDQIAISLNKGYTYGTLWAAAKTEHPEVIAKIVDYLYSDEGSTMHFYGPQKGKDPLGLLDGWYIGDKGVTCDLVENGTYANMTLYARQEVYPYDSIAVSASSDYVYEQTGYKALGEPRTFKDSVTGKTFEGNYHGKYEDLTVNDSWWRHINVAASEQHCTLISLPTAYLAEDDAFRATEILSLVKPHVLTETANFVTGLRPMEEIDEFFKELEELGIKELLEMYTEAYAPYIEATFG